MCRTRFHFQVVLFTRDTSTGALANMQTESVLVSEQQISGALVGFEVSVTRTQLFVALNEEHEGLSGVGVFDIEVRSMMSEHIAYGLFRSGGGEYSDPIFFLLTEI